MTTDRRKRLIRAITLVALLTPALDYALVRHDAPSSSAAFDTINNTLSNAPTVEKTENDLVRKFRTDLHRIHQAMVLFGRYICTAKNPKCGTACFLTDLCKSKESFKAR